MSRKSLTLFGLFFLLIFQFSKGQITNKEVVAKIKTEKVSDIITIKGTVESKTQLIKSLRYVMYLYQKNLTTSNIIKNEQSGRFVLQSAENKVLSEVTINQNTEDKVTVLILVYDGDDNLVAKDRLVVLNNDEIPKKDIVNEEVVKEENFESIRGIVIEKTRTKPGRDFYVEFYSKYRLKRINGREVVNITEKFSFGRNTIMEVSVGDRIVHRFFVQPTRDFILNQSNQAIVAVSNYFITLEQQKNYIKQY